MKKLDNYKNLNEGRINLERDLDERIRKKEENMKQNTNLFGGIVFSQKVLLELVDKGLSREEAYRIVQRNALDAFENNGNFRENLENDEDVINTLSTDDLDDCFVQSEYLKNINKIYEKFEL